MTTPDRDAFVEEIHDLRVEVAQLRARLEPANANSPRPSQVGNRSTAAGHDILVAAMEKTRMPIILSDPRQPDEPIVFANRAFQDLTGYSSEELVGRNCRFLQGSGTDRAKVTEIREALDERRDVAMPLVNYRRDGTRFVNDLYISPVFDEGGELLYNFGSQLDITQAYDDHEALTLSEQRYRTLFENLDEGFCIVQFIDGPNGPLSDYVHVEANSAYLKHTGFPEIIGKRLREIVADEADEWTERYGGVLRSGQPIHFDQELVATGRHLEVTAFRVEPASLDQVAVLFRDITARKQAERLSQELNEVLERRVAEALAGRKILADVFEGTDAFIQVVDLDMRWLAVNHAAAAEFERIYGARPKIGGHMLDALRDQPEQREAVRAVWARALAGEEFTLTAQFGDPDRDQRDYEMRFGVLRDGDGERIGAYQFVYDVTERLREQIQLATAEESLRQSQKMEAVGQLTGGVAHDFNNLLTIIRSSVDFLKRPDLAENRRIRYIDAVSETVDRAAKLTGQLLAFARRQALTPTTFDVNAQVRGIADMLDTVTGSRVRVEVETPDHSCSVVADISQFETALVNMAVNARDAMDGEGTLSLKVHCGVKLPPLRSHPGKDGPFTAVEVSDTGGGIAPDALERIFEPFFTTKGVGKGTGLGLSQVIGFAKQSGGDVGVRSSLGKGTTFHLYVPHAAEDVPAEEVREVPVMALHEGTLSVLLVEDNVEVGRIATQVLQDLGNTTVWVSSGEAALIELHKDPRRFDVVFSDVVMPGMGGIALAREVARLMPYLPVVLTSGYSEVLAQEGTQGFELIRKPYSAKDIASVLQRAVEGKR